MLDELDFVSGVSGGSFPAAWYVEVVERLHGREVGDLDALADALALFLHEARGVPTLHSIAASRLVLLDRGGLEKLAQM